MKTQLLEDDLWPTITGLARKAHHGLVAVAYLASGARRQLPLHAGDCLVVDMSKGAVKSGQTDPFEVEKYLTRGVKVYTCGNLHAKVYIFDRTIIVGSANVSRRSKNHLVEVGLQCQDREVLAQARGFVRSLQKEMVTRGYVEICKKLYTPPRMPPPADRGEGKGRVPRHSPIWILGVWSFTPSREEEELYDIEEKKALKRIVDTHKFETGFIRWAAESRGSGSIREGHFVVQVDHRGKDPRVLPPCRVVRLTKYKDDKRRQWLVIWLEEPKRMRSLSWRSFSNYMTNVGISRLGRNPQRLVRSPEAADVILGLWS